MTTSNVIPQMIKGEEFAHFHVFTDGNDFHFPVTESYNKASFEAYNCTDKLFKEGKRNIRLYYVNEMKDPRDGEIIQLEETLLFELGNYPS